MTEIVRESGAGGWADLAVTNARLAFNNPENGTHNHVCRLISEKLL